MLPLALPVEIQDMQVGLQVLCLQVNRLAPTALYNDSTVVSAMGPKYSCAQAHALINVLVKADFPELFEPALVNAGWFLGIWCVSAPSIMLFRGNCLSLWSISL